MNEDLIRALRCTKNENADCLSCKYQVLHEGGYDYCDQERLEIDAAEALKDLDAENAALHKQLARVTDERDEAMPMKSNRFDHIIETLVIVIIRMSVYYGAALLFIALFAFAIIGGTAFSRLIGIDENIVALGLIAACLVAAIIRQCIKKEDS
ncbi:hypothetical protein [Anaerotruncus massiliensis (ex Liu et al. 2021)]|uniref:hypothetical protein n=1 Tax=Anaerotruncus massiliensis (ex Liu et al. 2021) TaxID=2321404 RepID=UPI003AB34D48